MSWHREGIHRRFSTDHDRRPSILNSDVTPKKQCNELEIVRVSHFYWDRMSRFIGTHFGRHARDAEDLIKWIVAADQWPYRISYILQVVEDLDNRYKAGISETIIDEACTLFEIYE